MEVVKKIYKYSQFSKGFFSPIAFEGHLKKIKEYIRLEPGGGSAAPEFPVQAQMLTIHCTTTIIYLGLSLPQHSTWGLLSLGWPLLEFMRGKTEALGGRGRP